MLPFSIILNLILVAAFFVLIAKIGGWNHFIYKIQNRGLAGTYQHRSELLDQLPVTSEDIVFLGNSITQYCEWSELLQNPKVKNRGIAGDGIDGVLKRIQPILAEKPKAIYLMIGVNDLFFHDETYIIEGYEKLLQQCASVSPETKVIVQSVLPVNGDIKTMTISNASIVSLNEKLKELSGRYQLDYLDLHAHFKNEEGKLKPQYSVDGIHINGAAYERWKELLDGYPK